MALANTGQVHACRIRVALLGADGTPVAGASLMYVSKSLVSVAFAPQYTDGDEIEEKNACGEVEVNYKAPDTFKRGDITITLITPDPYLQSLLSGGVVLVDGTATGYGAPAIGLAPDDVISVEVWAKRITNGAPDPDYPYAQWGYPLISSLRLQDFSQAGEANKPSFVGQAHENPNWDDGPANDWNVATDRVFQWMPVTGPLPTPSTALIAIPSQA